MDYRKHETVFREECVSFLTEKGPFANDSLFADLTFGGGGHSKALLDVNESYRILAFDQDPEAIENGKEIISKLQNPDRIRLIHGNFQQFPKVYKDLANDFKQGLQGIVMDLGVSSHHFDKPDRGFSLRFDAPLDMRMNPQDEEALKASDVLNTFSKEDLDIEKLSQSKFLYFTGYMWDTESQKTAIKTAIKTAKQNNIRIIFDVADPFVVKRNRKEFLEIIKKDIDIVFANQSELAILYETNDFNASANHLGQIVKIAGIKLGKKGSIIVENGKQTIIPPRAIIAKDTTGAGDMFAAGFIASLCKGSNPTQAGKHGSILAEEIIQLTGAQFDLKKIEKFSSSLFKNT